MSTPFMKKKKLLTVILEQAMIQETKKIGRLVTLKEFLDKEGVSQRAFARALSISNSTVAAISRGKRPSKKIAHLIEAKTYGKVKAADLLKQDPWRRVALYR